MKHTGVIKTFAVDLFSYINLVSEKNVFNILFVCSHKIGISLTTDRIDGQKKMTVRIETEYMMNQDIARETARN